MNGLRRFQQISDNCPEKVNRQNRIVAIPVLPKVKMRMKRGKATNPKPESRRETKKLDASKS